MKMKAIFASIVIAVVLPIGTAWAEPYMNPGKWEITTKTEMAGIPPQSLTHTQCITAEDMVPMSQDANNECQVTDIKTRGNTVSWKITCGSGKMNGTGSVAYSENSMNGEMNMTIAAYGTKIKNTLSGRRTGACNGQSDTETSKITSQRP